MLRHLTASHTGKCGRTAKIDGSSKRCTSVLSYRVDFFFKTHHKSTVAQSILFHIPLHLPTIPALNPTGPRRNKSMDRKTLPILPYARHDPEIASLYGKPSTAAHASIGYKLAAFKR